MVRVSQAIRQMISISASELAGLLGQCHTRVLKKREIVSPPGLIPNEIFFINKGILRVTITNLDGIEHSIHFALEDHFIADYSSFIQRKPSLYTLQALEETELVVMPRAAIKWGYLNLEEGEKLGRLIAEFYFYDRFLPWHNTSSPQPIKKSRT